MTKEILKLWAAYEKKRNEIVCLHRQSWDKEGRSPKNIWMFATHPNELFRRYIMPPYYQEKRLRRWIIMAIARCDDALQNPEGYPKYLTHPKGEKPAV